MLENSPRKKNSFWGEGSARGSRALAPPDPPPRRAVSGWERDHRSHVVADDVVTASPRIAHAPSGILILLLIKAKLTFPFAEEQSRAPSGAGATNHSCRRCRCCCCCGGSGARRGLQSLARHRRSKERQIYRGDNSRPHAKIRRRRNIALAMIMLNQL